MARDQSKLHPILQYKMKQLIELCEKEGLKIGIGECVRSVKEQNELYAKGRTKPGSIVTNAKGSTYSSLHQWGIAFDFYRNDGKGAYNESGGFFKKVGKIAVSIGLEWGGNWKSFVDQPHIQLPYWGSTSTKLKSKYKTPKQFMATWNPKKPEKLVKRGSSKEDVQWIQEQICKLTTISLEIDGLMGKKTEDAIRAYQLMLGWKGSDKAGIKTINALAKNRTK